jgi:SAM-dependent methyltransferase/uncharacterized protein YbaR (Trm112 family)
MRRDAISILQCPACGGQLALARPVIVDDLVDTGELTCGCGESFAIVDGIPDLVFPRGQAYGPEDADTYDRGIAFIARLLNEDEGAVRAGAADLLDLRPGGRVLEVACGPGPNLPHLQERVGAHGTVYAFDISPTMIRAAAQRAAGSSPPVELLLGNGVHLPFADGSFDAVLHVGTLNRFSDVPRALSEMARVVRVGGKVLAADEGLAPWLVSREYGSVLMRFGGLFKGAPPLAAIPPNAEKVVVRWLMGHAYFGIEFRVGARPPQLNLDVPLPGRTVTVRDVLEATSAARGKP